MLSSPSLRKRPHEAPSPRKRPYETPTLIRLVRIELLTAGSFDLFVPNAP